MARVRPPRVPAERLLAVGVEYQRRPAEGASGVPELQLQPDAEPERARQRRLRATQPRVSGPRPAAPHPFCASFSSCSSCYSP
eukprot:1307776-Rhodomonas_salina.1